MQLHGVLRLRALPGAASGAARLGQGQSAGGTDLPGFAAVGRVPRPLGLPVTRLRYQPGHVCAEALADGFGGVAAASVEEGLEAFEAGLFFGRPFAGELSGIPSPSSSSSSFFGLGRFRQYSISASGFGQPSLGVVSFGSVSTPPRPFTFVTSPVSSPTSVTVAECTTFPSSSR